MQNYVIHMLGFSEFEQSTLESFFRIASQRLPGVEVTNALSKASIVMLNATSREYVHECAPLILSHQKALIVGESDFDTGWPVLPRPMRLTSVLAKLKAMDSNGNADAWAETIHLSLEFIPDDTPMEAPVQAPVEVPEKRIQAPVVSLDKARSFVAPKQDEVVTNPSAAPDASVGGRILVVDDSDVALKFMQSRLRRLGYESQVVRSGEEALAMVAAQRFQFVFLDVMMEGLDGYQTCKAIKQNKARRGPQPVVVMLTSRGGTIDKIRGTMAGCDAYLTKPLNERQLLAVMDKHGANWITAGQSVRNTKVARTTAVVQKTQTR